MTETKKESEVLAMLAAIDLIVLGVAPFLIFVDPMYTLALAAWSGAMTYFLSA